MKLTIEINEMDLMEIQVLLIMQIKRENKSLKLYDSNANINDIKRNENLKNDCINEIKRLEKLKQDLDEQCKSKRYV